MVSVYDVKPGFQKLLRPLVKLLARSGVTANQVTIAAVLLSFGAGTWLAIDRGTGSTLPGYVSGQAETVPQIFFPFGLPFFLCTG